MFEIFSVLVTKKIGFIWFFKCNWVEAFLGRQLGRGIRVDALGVGTKKLGGRCLEGAGAKDLLHNR